MHDDNVFDRKRGTARIFVADAMGRREDGEPNYNTYMCIPIDQHGTKSVWRISPFLTRFENDQESKYIEVSNDESPRELIRSHVQMLNLGYVVGLAAHDYLDRKLVKSFAA